MTSDAPKVVWLCGEIVYVTLHGLPPGDVTVSAIVVDEVNVPEVPVTVTVAVPAAAVLPALIVSTLLLVAGFVPNEAVTPVGNPEAARVTLPLKGAISVTVMVSVPLEP